MNAPLLKLKCDACGGVFESMIILLPEHDYNDHTTFKPLACPGSNTLATRFVDMCPICEVHGMRDDCSCCKGTHEVYTPIVPRIEQELNGVWMELSFDGIREIFAKLSTNPDECIAALYAGEIIKTKTCTYRRVAGANETTVPFQG